MPLLRIVQAAEGHCDLNVLLGVSVIEVFCTQLLRGAVEEIERFEEGALSRTVCTHKRGEVSHVSTSSMTHRKFSTVTDLIIIPFCSLLKLRDPKKKRRGIKR